MSERDEAARSPAGPSAPAVVALRGSGGETLDISAIQCCPQLGDHELRVRVVVGDYCGFAGGWVDRVVAASFVEQLRELERLRRGQAELVSISPGDLRLVLRAADGLGHMCATGVVGRSGIASVTFPLRFEFGFHFDPDPLPALVRGFEGLFWSR